MFNSIWDIIAICVIGVFVILIIFIASILFKKLTFKRKDTEISFLTNNDEKIINDDSNKIILILKLLQKTEENVNIKSSIIPEQMKYTDLKLDLLKEKSINIFSDLLEENKNDEYKIFIKTIKEVFRLIKDSFRKSFIENGILEKEDFDWEKWKREKIEFLISLFHKQLEIEYLNILPIKRTILLEELKKEKYFEEMHEKFYEILNEAKKISSVKNKEMQKNRCDMDEYALKIFGIDLNLDNDVS